MNEIFYSQQETLLSTKRFKQPADNHIDKIELARAYLGTILMTIWFMFGGYL